MRIAEEDGVGSSLYKTPRARGARGVLYSAEQYYY